MSNKKILLIIIVILLIAVIGTITIINKNGKDKEELQTINVSEVTRSVFYAPQYVAINNGFFEKKWNKHRTYHIIRSRCSNDSSLSKSM